MDEGNGRGTRWRVTVINSPPSGGSKENDGEGSYDRGGRVCQREANEIVLKFHLAGAR